MFDGEATRERIREVFCPDCKFNKACKSYEVESGICKNFTYRSKKSQEEYEQQVARNTAITLWLSKDKTLEEIYSFTEKELLSILQKPVKASQPVAKKTTSPFPQIKAPAIQSQDKYLYFNTEKAGKQKTFKRSIKNQSEINSTRKYLLANGYKILEEIIK